MDIKLKNLSYMRITKNSDENNHFGDFGKLVLFSTSSLDAEKFRVAAQCKTTALVKFTQGMRIPVNYGINQD